MPSRDLKLRRTFVVLSACTLVVFAALLGALTTALRGRLQREIQQREARAIHDVAVMQISAAETRLHRLQIEVTTADVFATILESRLHDVLAVQLFDANGVLRDALPAVATEAGNIRPWWPSTLAAPDARYYSRGHLEQILGLAADAGAEADSTPLLEVVVPLQVADKGGSYGVARYWLDGRQLAAEFSRLDRSLATEASVAFIGGAALIAALLVWSYRSLTQAHTELLTRTADLERANQELDFAAKTGALGAISAHLIHGIKNPLAGLEGFVSDAATDDPARMGEARETAMETARRLRAMVNDVVTVLRDETSGTASYLVPLEETLTAVVGRASAAARSHGVALVLQPTPKATWTARTANLAGLVLANLLTNAIEASPRGGTVQLDSRVENGRIEVMVRDDGPGLPASVRNALFRPVVSTKRNGGGMGLAISARLARHAGGELSLLDSTRGCRFRLSVPAGVAVVGPLETT